MQSRGGVNILNGWITLYELGIPPQIIQSSGQEYFKRQSDLGRSSVLLLAFELPEGER